MVYRTRENMSDPGTKGNVSTRVILSLLLQDSY